MFSWALLRYADKTSYTYLYLKDSTQMGITASSVVKVCIALDASFAAMTSELTSVRGPVAVTPLGHLTELVHALPVCFFILMCCSQILVFLVDLFSPKGASSVDQCVSSVSPSVMPSVKPSLRPSHKSRSPRTFRPSRSPHDHPTLKPTRRPHAHPTI